MQSRRNERQATTRSALFVLRNYGKKGQASKMNRRWMRPWDRRPEKMPRSQEPTSWGANHAYTWRPVWASRPNHSLPAARLSTAHPGPARLQRQKLLPPFVRYSVAALLSSDMQTNTKPASELDRKHFSCGAVEQSHISKDGIDDPDPPHVMRRAHAFVVSRKV